MAELKITTTQHENDPVISGVEEITVSALESGDITVSSSWEHGNIMTMNSTEARQFAKLLIASADFIDRKELVDKLVNKYAGQENTKEVREDIADFLGLDSKPEYIIKCS